jgi:hypothetical protein
MLHSMLHSIARCLLLLLAARRSMQTETHAGSECEMAV